MLKAQDDIKFDNCPESCLMSILVWCQPWSDIKLEMISISKWYQWCRSWYDVDLYLISSWKWYQSWNDIKLEIMLVKKQLPKNIKNILRCLGTYKCQNKLTGDQEMNKITYKSQSRQLSDLEIMLGLKWCWGQANVNNCPESCLMLILIWCQPWSDIKLEMISILK